MIGSVTWFDPWLSADNQEREKWPAKGTRSKGWPQRVSMLTTKLRDAEAALGRIETFGYANPGDGLTCARIASEALGKEPR